jgi:tetratricopeptide (TPR) repeat protein
MNRIAWCYRKTGNYEKAVEYYRDVEKLEPDNLMVQASLGQSFMEMENYKEALKYYFKVEYLQPDNHKVYRPISWCSLCGSRCAILEKFEGSKKTIIWLAYWYRVMTKAIENYSLSFTRPIWISIGLPGY